VHLKDTHIAHPVVSASAFESCRAHSSRRRPHRLVRCGLFRVRSFPPREDPRGAPRRPTKAALARSTSPLESAPVAGVSAAARADPRRSFSGPNIRQKRRRHRGSRDHAQRRARGELNENVVREAITEMDVRRLRAPDCERGGPPRWDDAVSSESRVAVKRRRTPWTAQILGGHQWGSGCRCATQLRTHGSAPRYDPQDGGCGKGQNEPQNHASTDTNPNRSPREDGIPCSTYVIRE
jgi:hypothetical protein